MSKALIVLVVIAACAAAGCWLFGDTVWNALLAMHGHR